MCLVFYIGAYMKSFIDKIDGYLNKFSYTENGATAYKTSGKKLTDFNFKVSYYREHPQAIETDFVNLLENCESNETIARFLFYIGDIREGLGEREIFKICLKRFLKSFDDERVEKIMKLIPEYNRWDSFWKIAIDDEELFQIIIPIINNQLLADLKNLDEEKPVSLLAKWLPSENASSKTTKESAKKIRKSLRLSPKEYRLVISSLRAYIDVTEVKMSANNWNKINYESVPSKANLNYANAFMKHDTERRIAYINSLKNGEIKINSSVNYPYEIVDKYVHQTYSWSRAVIKYDEIYEQMWKALPKLNIKNTLVIRDGSGSMMSKVGNTNCLSVATSLAIYLSENNSNIWKDKFITFSSRPKIIDLSYYKNLMDKINRSYEEADCSNTNIYETMKLILDTAIENHVSQKEMPEMILIISDMQFDGIMFHMNGSLFDNIKQEFKEAGYVLPKICFWNVAGRSCGTIPLQENEYGLILCSGFSINIIKMFLSNEIDPYKILMDTLYSKRYDPIGEIFTK